MAILEAAFLDGKSHKPTPSPGVTMAPPQAEQGNLADLLKLFPGGTIGGN